jgi:DNA mismatch repair protein MutL
VETASSPKRIQQLHEQLANQIAAGEVVERPSAALKELVENSLDAGARRVTVRLSQGGVKLLEVADDGSGIVAEDFPLALGRHATSKIRATEDLFSIRTWGFRGEALASIGAVSRLTLSSRTAAANLGREWTADGGQMRSDKSVARPVGTTVRVEDLFYNTPARRKFLKSQGAETAQCWQTLHRLALASPDVSFEAWLDEEKVFHYPATSNTRSRVVQVFREAWSLKVDESDLLEIQQESPPLKLSAFLLPARFFIPSTRGILTFVNQRAVKDKLLQQAILAASKEVLFGKLYPQLVLSLEAPPDWVDVNVHPAKSEVRFREPGHVFAFVRKYLERALADDRRGSVDLNAPAPPENFPSGASATPFPHLLAETMALPLPETAVHYHQKAAPLFSPRESVPALPPPSPAAAPASEIAGARSGPQFLGTLRNTYLVCQDEEGLLLVDQHAAHERVTYEKLKRHRLSSRESTPLLISFQVELPRTALDRLEPELPRFAEMGLVLDRTGPSLLAVRELPAFLLNRDGTTRVALGPFLRRLGEDWDENAPAEELTDRLREILLEQLASESCHGSVRAGQSLSREEAQALLSQMSETDFSGHCPHGRPTTVRFRWTEIERLFKRIV